MVKRLAAFILTVLVCICAARAETAVNRKHSAALISADGTEIIPFGEYTHIEPLTEGYYSGTGSDGLCVLIDQSGAVVTERRFEDLKTSGDSLLFESGGAWGILNADGTELTPARYSDIRSNGEGDYLALRAAASSGNARLLDFIDEDGEAFATGVRILYELSDFSDGMMPVLLAKTGRFGYLDTQGVVAFSAVYTAASAYMDGLAVVSDENGTGVIDVMGREVVPLRYETILRAGSLLLMKKQDGGAAVTRPDGTKIQEFPSECEVFTVGEYGAVYRDTGIYVLDTEGRVSFTAGINEVLTAGTDGGIIRRDGLWGERASCLSDSGGAAVSESYQSIVPLGISQGETLYAVSRFQAEAVRGDDGTVLFYDWTPSDIRFAVMDGNGVLRTDFVYTYLCAAADGLIYCEREDGFGLITPDGDIVWDKTETAGG